MVIAVNTERSGLWSVYKQEMGKSKSPKMILNFASASISLSNVCFKNTPSSLVALGKNIKQVNSFIGLLEFPIKVEKFFKSLFSFNTKKPLKNGIDLATNFCSVVSGGCSVVKFVDTMRPLQKPFMQKIKWVGGYTGLILAVKGFVESLFKLKDQIFSYSEHRSDALNNKISVIKFSEIHEKSKFEFASNILSIAAKTTVLALAIIGLVALFVPVSTVVITVVGFSSAFLALTSFFFERVFLSKEAI